MVDQEITSQIKDNAAALDAELEWMQIIIETRMENQNPEKPAPDISHFPSPELTNKPSMYANFVQHYNMNSTERLLILLALIPHIRPQMLDIFLQINTVLNRGYTEFGGIQGKAHGGFLPTGETALYLLASDNLRMRFEYQQLFDRDHFFARHNILKLEPVEKGEPINSGQLVLADEIIDFLTNGELRKPDFSRDFPARLLSSEMEWDDLVLSPETLEQLTELQAWIDHEQTLMNDWGLGKRLRPGYKCLFYGPSGTGKTITATVLGKFVEKDVYRIDLSSVISKYIGETEKNLATLFDKAEHKNWILFFDEADSLFGKRTQVRDSHDRYANQEVSFLLQRIETFDGLVILASNLATNVDEAFSRRFEQIIHFPMPRKAERLQLWQKGLPLNIKLDADIDLTELANRHEISGGMIMNVIRHVCMQAISRQQNTLLLSDFNEGIRREFAKENRLG